MKADLCGRHYREEYGMSAEKQCSREGCDNLVQRNGLCCKHYKDEKFGTMIARKQCSYEGCDRQVRKDGLCARHYREKFGATSWKVETMQQRGL